MGPPNLKELVAEKLKADGFDGFYNEDGECACEVSDLFPCGEPSMTGCRAGYKGPCDASNCANGGGCNFHIWGTKPEVKAT